MDFDLIKRAGITQKEFGQLCGVSRATVNLWVTGRFKPHRYLGTRVQRALDSLSGAIDGGRLPLLKETPDDTRLAELKKALTPAKVAA